MSSSRMLIDKMMKRYIGLLFALMFTVPLLSQNADELYRKANELYVTYEEGSERNSKDRYEYLYRSYDCLTQILELDNSGQYESLAKSKLVSEYPLLKNASVYYSNAGNYPKAYQFGIAYVRLPQNKNMLSEPLEHDADYPTFLYNTGYSSVQVKQYDDALYCFNEYLEHDYTDYKKACYTYIIGIYRTKKDYANLSAILTKAIDDFPNELDFRYSLYNMYLDTKNSSGMLGAIDGILSIDPNNKEILPIKAQMEYQSGNLKEARDIYSRLLALKPNDTSVLKSLAICDYKLASSLNNAMDPLASEEEKMEIRQNSFPYLSEARTSFEKLLQIDPKNQTYLNALGQCFLYLGLDVESETMAEILEKEGGYNEYSRLLAEKKSAKPISEDVIQNAFSGLPPVLLIKNATFSDVSGNNVIDGGEAFTIAFTLENAGEGDAENVRLRFWEDGTLDQYIKGMRNQDLGIIKAHSQRDFEFSYIADADISDGNAQLTVKAFEGNSFDSDPLYIKVLVQEKSRPRLRIADARFISDKGSAITIGERGKLQLALQNYGSADALDAKISFKCPDNVIPVSDSNPTLDTLHSGMDVVVSFDFMVNKRFSNDSIAIKVSVDEQSKTDFVEEIYKVKLGDYLSTATALDIQGALEQRTGGVRNITLSMEGELFTDVPQGTLHENRFALIIGNEIYSTIGGSSEINVPYAVNDASAFREYCIKTFGVPNENVKFLPNATTGMMVEAVAWLESVGRSNPQSELFFYYSGHGCPDESENLPYLLPVDLSGKNAKLGISLNELYKELSACGCMGAYIFLDACFSGGYKSAAPLVATKSVRIAPKYERLSGNVISFTSSSGEQTSSVFDEKKHGIFTYYLLKSIKDSNGDISFQDIYDQTRQGVLKTSSKLGKEQSPQVITSSDWPDWGAFRLK